MHTMALRRRTSAFRPWSSAPDARRFRRPTDILLLVVACLITIPLALLASGTSPLEAAISSLSGALAEFLDWVWGASYALLAAWAAVIVLLTALSRGRRRILLDYLVAAAFAAGGGLVVIRVATGAWPDSLSGLVNAEPRPADTAIVLALATAVLVTASPHLRHSLRLFGRLVLLLGTIAVIGLEIATPAGAVASLAVGVAAAAAAHLLLGTPAGRATTDQVADALGELGVATTAVEEARVQQPGVATMVARSSDGTDLFVKVYGRDAWDGQVVGSLWTSLTRRGERPVLLRSRESRVDHEAVVTLLAERSGVPVVPVVTCGRAPGGDALLVTASRGPDLSSSPDVDDAYVASAWSALLRLNEIGIAHGSMGAAALVRAQDGTCALCDFDAAELAADPSSMMADRARLLTATAVSVGRDRAVAAAIAALGADGLAEVLPYLQPAVMDARTGQAVKDEEWSLAELRAAAVTACGIDAPPLQQVRRVTVKSILMVLVIGLVAYTLIAMLAGVDLATVVQELSAANKWILFGALLLSPFVQAGFAFATMGASPNPLRYRPVLMLQYAIQFIALTLPATAARIALEVRFFQRFGLPATTAVSIGVIDSVTGFGVQIALIILILVSGLPAFTSSVRSSSTSTSSTDSSTPALLYLTIALIVIGIVAALVVPRFRRRLMGIVPRVRAAIAEQSVNAKSALAVLRRPRKVATMAVGNLVAQVIQAIILGVCLAAFGDTAYLSQLILINTAVSLFAGLMPVPGGMGVAEAGYTVGLQAIGVPSAVAMSTAIAFRLVTFYLPPIWGAWAMRWLRRSAYV
ncbi:MAG: hypothetical protein QG661_782 [Actinomycetota bacterium]|nr:hypothetical protein [Actinomycetota bacterium]